MSIFEKKEKSEDEYIQLNVKALLDWNGKGPDGCIASDKITKGGWKVGYMFREEPKESCPDSGWRFFKGDEDGEYMGNAYNHHIFALNTICNYDSDIIPYLDFPVGTHLIRNSGQVFIKDNQTQPIVFCKQDGREDK